MALEQGQTYSFKAELYQGVHNLLTDTLKIALYSDSANLPLSTTVYTTTGEISGTGYVAGGVVLTGATVAYSENVAYVSFANPVWNPASFTARGAMIYNSSKADRSIAILDFGADKTASSSFTITLPPNTATSALIRSA